MSKNAERIRIIGFVVFASGLLLLQSCRKKNRTDEDIAGKIVGSWQTKTGGSITEGNTYRIMEFDENGMYRSISLEGRIDGVKNADTAGAECVAQECSGITFADSVFYKIVDGYLIYPSRNSNLINEFEIKWINNHKMRIDINGLETYKRIKQ